MDFRAGFKTVWKAVMEFIEDNALTLAAALSFYTALSLSPLMVILVSVGGLLGPGMQDKLVEQITVMIGTEAGEAISLVLRNASQDIGGSKLSAVIGIATLVFSATGVFGQLQTSLNAIWNVEARPTRPGASIWAWARKRVLSLGMLLVLGFLLLVSLFFSAVVAMVLPKTGWVWQLMNSLVTLGVSWLLFALIFKFLPDVKIAWRYVWTGALITAVLFNVGKYAISNYLGRSGVASSYGAAGSLVVFLLWVYYSSLILFFGAELTQARAGKRVQPEDHAVKVKEVVKKPEKT